MFKFTIQISTILALLVLNTTQANSVGTDEADPLILLDDTNGTSQRMQNFEELIEVKLAHHKDSRTHPNVQMTSGKPPGGWDGWTYQVKCEGIELPCYYRGSEDPHKVLIWLHGMGWTGLLPSTITDGLPDNVRVIQVLDPDRAWWTGVKPINMFNAKDVAICTSNLITGFIQTTLPNWMKRYIPNFYDGLASRCNLYMGVSSGGFEYQDSVTQVSKLIQKMALKTGSMQSIAVGGYSQGGPTIVDAALGIDQAVGSIVLVGSTVFDNNLAMSQSKDFRQTRGRAIFGSLDVWFPPDYSSKQMRKIVDKYQLQNIGSMTVAADHSMADYNDEVANIIYETIKTEVRAIYDFKATRIMPYGEECCSDDFKNNCSNFDECIVNVKERCWSDTAKQCDKSGCKKCQGQWLNLFCAPCLFCLPYQSCIDWEWCLDMPYDKCMGYERCSRGGYSCVKPVEPVTEPPVEPKPVVETGEYTQFNNYCVQKDGSHITRSSYSRGNESVEMCKLACDSNYKCKAVEWFESKIHGPCLHINSEDDIENLPSRGFVGGRYADAVCYVKKVDEKSQTFDSYTQYNNYCVQSNGEDTTQESNRYGNESLERCKKLCDVRQSCNAIEWFESGVHGPCLHTISLDGVSNMATRGATGTRYEDAVCYVKGSKDKVILYEHINFGGRAVPFGEGDHDCDEIGDLNFNDQMSSMKVPEGYQVTIYKNCFKGKSYNYQGPKDIIQFPGFNDKLSSLTVTKIKEESGSVCCEAITSSCLSCVAGISEADFCKNNAGRYGCPEEKVEKVTLYSGDNYNGKSVIFGIGAYSCNDFQKLAFDNMMSSMKVPEGLEVTIYKDCFDGIHTIIYGPYESKGNLDSIFNNEVSSIEVNEHGHTESEQVIFTTGNNELHAYLEGSYGCPMGEIDATGGIKVPEGLQITLWYECYEGQSKTFTGPIEIKPFSAEFRVDWLQSFQIRKSDDATKFTIFEHQNYFGRSESFAIGSYDCQQMGTLIDKMTSFKIPAGIEVKLHNDCFRTEIYQPSKSIIQTVIGPAQIPSVDQIDFPNDQLAALEVKYAEVTAVTLYDGPNFEGRAISFGLGLHNCDEFSKLDFHDKMTSIKIPAGLKVTLYENCYRGKKNVLNGPFESKQIPNFSDMLSSMIVEPSEDQKVNVVRLFEHENFGGRIEQFDLGGHSCNDFSELNFHDKASSIKVPEGLTVTVYEDCFGGKSETFQGPFEGKELKNQDIVSSLIVVKTRDYGEVEDDTNKVILYEFEQFLGESVSFDEGDHSCDEFTRLNFHDKMNSMKVPAGYKVTIYADCFDGKSLTFVGPYETKYLYGFIDSLSSLKMFKVTEACCEALTMQCEACRQGITVEDYCNRNPGKYDCPEIENFIIYEDSDYRGISQQFKIGVYDNVKFSQFYNIASSLKVPAGIQAILYSKKFDSGNDQTIRTVTGPVEITDITQIGFNHDELSALIVRSYNDDQVTFFERMDINGRDPNARIYQATEGEYSCGQLGDVDFRFADSNGIQVPGGYSLELFENCDSDKSMTFKGPFEYQEVSYFFQRFTLTKTDEKVIQMYDQFDFDGRRSSFGLGYYPAAAISTSGLRSQIGSFNVPLGLLVTFTLSDGTTETFEGPRKVYFKGVEPQRSYFDVVTMTVGQVVVGIKIRKIASNQTAQQTKVYVGGQFTGTVEQCAQKVIETGKKCGSMEFIGYESGVGCYCWPYIQGNFKDQTGLNIYMLELPGINIITLYDAVNYGGNYLTLPVGDYSKEYLDEQQWGDSTNSLKVPDSYELKAFDQTGAQHTFTGPMSVPNISDISVQEEAVSRRRQLNEIKFTSFTSSVEDLGGCCQISETNNGCANWEYARGLCIELSSKNIGCTRQFWNANAKYDEASGKCIKSMTMSEAEDLAAALELKEKQEAEAEETRQQNETEEEKQRQREEAEAQAQAEQEREAEIAAAEEKKREEERAKAAEERRRADEEAARIEAENAAALEEAEANTIKNFPTDTCMLLHTQLDKDLCLDASGPMGTPIAIRKCDNENFNQILKYDQDTKEILLFYSKNCLNIDNSNKKLDPFVNFWLCDESDQRKWLYDFEFSRVKNSIDQTNPCLDVLMSVKESGTPIQPQNCNESEKQKWLVQQVECPDMTALTQSSDKAYEEYLNQQGSEQTVEPVEKETPTDQGASPNDSHSQNLCCTLPIAKCKACEQKISETLYCEMAPTTFGCVDESAQTQECCSIDHAKCMACDTQTTIEQVCQIMPDLPGCHSVSSHSNLDRRECCQLETAECYACQTGVTITEYCQYEPSTPGCKNYISNTDTKNEDCCDLPIARCISCQALVSIVEYCEYKPETTGCPTEDEKAEVACCAIPIAKCLSCQNNISQEAYCDLNPDTTGCVVEEPEPEPTRTECCTLDIAECHACGNNVNIEDWCLYKPETSGCPEKQDEQTQVEECCDLPIVRCQACLKGISEFEYCEYYDDTMKGCNKVYAAIDAQNRFNEKKEDALYNEGGCLIEAVNLFGTTFDILCQANNLKLGISIAIIGILEYIL